MFVASESSDFSCFINSLSKLDYDLSNLEKYDYMKLLDSTPYDSDYFLIDGVLMVSDKLKLYVFLNTIFPKGLVSFLSILTNTFEC